MAFPTNPPVNPVPGAIYVDTATNISWVWTGVSWIQAGGSDGYNSQVKFGMAITPGFYTGLSSSGTGGAGNLASIATQYGPTAPLNPAFGQIWVDTTNADSPSSYVWVDPGEWNKISDGVTNTFVSNDAPTGSLEIGDTWYEGDTGTFYVWDGAQWRPIGGGAGGGTSTNIISYISEPTVGAEGSVYYNSTEDKIYVSDGTVWTEILQAPDTDTHSIVALSAPTLRPDGSALQAGDNWIDTSNNTFYYFNGTIWTRLSSASAGDTHSFYQTATPLLRPDNSPLVQGDVWINATNGYAYVWTNTLWTPIQYANNADTQSIPRSLAPATRPSGFMLEVGDMWVDTDTGYISYWTGSSWAPTAAPYIDTHSIVSATSPIQRDSGAPLQEGDLWIDSDNDAVSYYTGTAWKALSGITIDSHCFTGVGAPTITVRPDSTPLQTGDQYVNITNEVLYYWDGLAWVAIGGGTDTHSFTGVANPTLTVRPSGAALQTGDQYINTSTGAQFYYNGSAWVALPTGSDTHAFTGSTNPTLTLRPSGSALVAGDQYINTATGAQFYYNGSAWVALPVDTHAFTGTANPTLTLRPDGKSLVTGDQYINTTAGTQFYYNGSAWVALATSSDTHAFTGTGNPTLTLRPNGTALQTGDQYINTTTGAVSYYNGSVWIAPPADTHAFTGTINPNLTARPDGTPLLAGDQYINTSTGAQFYYSGSAWVAFSGVDTGSEIIVSSTTPTVRPDGSALQTGDAWFARSGGETFRVYNGTSFLETIVEGNSNVQVSTTAPTTRRFTGVTNAGPLEIGDVWLNTSAGAAAAVMNYWSGTAWVPVPTGAPVDATPTVEGILYGYTPNTSDGDTTINTFLGYGAGNTTLSGQYNTVIGQTAGQSMTTAVDNIIIGRSAGANATSFGRNIIIGKNAGSTSTGNDQILIGEDAGRATTGGDNIFIGKNSGYAVTSGTRNVVIGSYQFTGNPTPANEIVLSLPDTGTRRLHIGGSGGWELFNSTGTSTGTGTSGQVLTSQGASAPPIWAAAAGGSETHLTLASNVIDVQAADYFTRNISSNTTFSFTNAPAAPNVASFIVKVASSGSFTVAWPAAVRWPGGADPVQTASGTDIYGFFTVDAGTTYYGVRLSANALP